MDALFDIHRELDYSEKNELKRTRNTLTHRFVNIKITLETEYDENMTESTLFIPTLELAKLVRNSVMYLLHFLNIEEIKKQNKMKGLTLPLLTHALPDKLKSSRKKSSKLKTIKLAIS